VSEDNLTQETEFVWPPELIAQVAAEMDYGLKLFAEYRWSMSEQRWIHTSKEG